MTGPFDVPQKQTILIVDDTPDNIALLSALLKDRYRVKIATNGVKALQEAGVFGTRPVPFFEFDWLGIHADAYSLGAQAIALTAIAVLYGRSRLAEKRRLETAG